MRGISYAAILWALGLWLALAGSVAAQTGGFGTGFPLSGAPETPLQVAVGIEIDQITSVDQKAENFGAVATIRLNWQDPALAFGAEGDGDRVMTPANFYKMANDIPTMVPGFVVQNQQGNRWVQESFVVIRPNGEVFFAERGSATLQAPLFNFRRYPFDRQIFLYDVRSMAPASHVNFVPMDDHWGLGEALGEEEWILENPRLVSTVETGMTGQDATQVSLQFEGRRHMVYYVLRIFVPLLVLIVVSWATFFLDEYRRRIDVAGAQLLVFVAFNFTISDSLPRLGYTTFLDFILQWMFVITGATIVVNVALRRLKVAGHEVLARRIDNWVIKWIYPLGYAAIIGYAIVRFLLVPA